MSRTLNNYTQIIVTIICVFFDQTDKKTNKHYNHYLLHLINPNLTSACGLTTPLTAQGLPCHKA